MGLRKLMCATTEYLIRTQVNIQVNIHVNIHSSEILAVMMSASLMNASEIYDVTMQASLMNSWHSICQYSSLRLDTKCTMLRHRIQGMMSFSNTAMP
ncbi:hypothetical protein BgiMline_021105 [Biomphalaria glabrata]|nr:hypothetical protein BgiMline_018260 [Biomphalaria glabrata]